MPGQIVHKCSLFFLFFRVFFLRGHYYPWEVETKPSPGTGNRRMLWCVQRNGTETPVRSFTLSKCLKTEMLHKDGSNRDSASRCLQILRPSSSRLCVLPPKSAEDSGSADQDTAVAPFTDSGKEAQTEEGYSFLYVLWESWGGSCLAKSRSDDDDLE